MGVNGCLLLGGADVSVQDDGISGDFPGNFSVLGLLDLVGVQLVVVSPADAEVSISAGWIERSKQGIP